MFPFEKLEVWHKAIDFADHVYRVTGAFPGNERFGLTSQMRRAAISTSSNIAEGSSRYSRNEFAHFDEIATGSLCEVVSQAAIAGKQGFLVQTAHQELYDVAEIQSRMLSGLRRSLGES